jgi:predicted amidophosphoribosyltransferase
VAVGPYATVLRGTLLAYKEKGRHRLARPLGSLLAVAVAEAARRGGAGPATPVRVIPVPSTAAAARERHGDHMARLALHTVRRLRSAGWHADVGRPLRALPRPDSALLDGAARAAAAESSLRIRGGPVPFSRRRPTMRGTLIVVDDIVTTGATLAAVASRLQEADMQVTGAAVLAATRLRGNRSPIRVRAPTGAPPGLKVPGSVPRTRGDGRPSAG